MSTPPSWPPPPPPEPPQPPPPPQGPPGFAAAVPTAPPGAHPLHGQPFPKTKSSSTVLIIVLLIVVVFGGIAFVGIVAAIAIPAFMRAKVPANEATVVSRMRTMASAQMTWATTHQGTFTAPSCLARPADCGDTTGSAFLPPEIASLESGYGYDYGFALRPPPDQPSDGDPNAFGGFAYWATPTRPGVTGRRTFCVSETGMVLTYLPPTIWVPPVEGDGRCPEGGRPE